MRVMIGGQLLGRLIQLDEHLAIFHLHGMRALLLPLRGGTIEPLLEDALACPDVDIVPAAPDRQFRASAKEASS